MPAKEGSFAKTWRYMPTPESSDGEESLVVELLFGVLVATTAFGLEVFLWRFGYRSGGRGRPRCSRSRRVA
jgi:hypothetical protein